MLNNIAFGKYIPIESKIHNIHPLVKVFCTFFVILSIVITKSIFLILLYTFVLIILLFLSKISWRIYVQSFWKMKYFLLTLLVINILFSGSVFSGIFIVWKMLLILFSSSILLYTTSSSQMVYGIKMFCLPLKLFKISSDKLALSLSLALRFIPILLEQANKILKSQISRGLSFEGKKLKEKIRSLKSLLIPMFILAVKRADTLAETMEVRQFSFSSPRSHYKKRNVTREEKIVMVVVIIQFVIVVSWRVLL